MIAVLLIVAAAVLVGLRRCRAERRPERRHRWRALLVVVGLVLGPIVAPVLLQGTAWASPFDCKEAPEPDRPGTGLVGSLDPAPLGLGAPNSVYSEVGYAGLVWHTYDLGCGGSVSDPSVSTDTWLGNQTFNLAKFAVGGVNWAHYLLARGGDILTPLDEVISRGTKAMYEGVFSTFIGPALLILAIILIMLAMRGELAKQAHRVAFAALALMLGSAAYLAPVNWAKVADGLLLDGVTQMQQGFLGPFGQGDVNTLPTVLTDNVIFANWERGEFGAPDDAKAQELGRDLLRAQTFTKQELADGKTQQADVDAKKKAFTDVAGKMGDRYPYFQGKTGSRIGVGVLAVIQAVCIALFQLLSKVLILVAMLMLRLIVMCLPLIGVLGVLRPQILPTIVKVGASALVNTLVVGALAGLHALLVISLFKPGSGVDLWLALLVTGVTTVVLWAVARPFRRLVSMVSLTREQFTGMVPAAGNGPMTRMWQRVSGAGSAGSTSDQRQTRWWDERRAGASGPGNYDDVDRPESASARGSVKAEATLIPEQNFAGGWRPDRRSVPGRSGASEGGQLTSTQRRALTSGPGGVGGLGAGFPRGAGPGAEPGENDERVIYRRPDAAPERPRPQRPVQAELVDGVPVYRIYRARPVSQGYDSRE